MFGSPIGTKPEGASGLLLSPKKSKGALDGCYICVCGAENTSIKSIMPPEAT